MQAQALYLGDYPVSSSLSRPIIVKKSTRTCRDTGV
ncbi:argininosuccinate synthase [Vibrio sinaloensis]|nr:argininosuccinate synthase [Vibrio sinaloensis]